MNQTLELKNKTFELRNFSNKMDIILEWINILGNRLKLVTAGGIFVVSYNYKIIIPISCEFYDTSIRCFKQLNVRIKIKSDLVVLWKEQKKVIDDIK